MPRGAWGGVDGVMGLAGENPIPRETLAVELGDVYAVALVGGRD
jgi:hypothetical protein